MYRELEDVYAEGFMDKCAEHGVDPVKLTEAAADQPDEAPLAKTKGMTPDQVAKYRAEQHKKIEQQRPGGALALRGVLHNLNPAGYK